MELILFCGLQATGKTTFYKEHFLKTHIRLSMDMLNTRNKEEKLMQACFSVQQPFVVDNTNPSKADREQYIARARQFKYKVIGYYFQSKIEEALHRNNARSGKEKVPELGIRGTYSRLQLPEPGEGFDELYYVEMGENAFIIKNWDDEVR